MRFLSKFSGLRTVFFLCRLLESRMSPSIKLSSVSIGVFFFITSIVGISTFSVPTVSSVFGFSIVFFNYYVFVRLEA